MAKTSITIRIDEDVKKDMKAVCDDLGISVSTAFNIFATKVSKEKRIPFELEVDPFYSKENMDYLKSIIDDIEKGKAHFAEHDLIEE